MKKTLFLTVFLQFIFGVLISQNQSDNIKNFMTGKTEDDCRNVLTSWGYIVQKSMVGYPECLNGYAFYSNQMTFNGNTQTIPHAIKMLYIEDGSIVVLTKGLGENMGCKIIYTFSVKNNIESEFLVFVGDKGWVYLFNLVDFKNAMPLTLEIIPFKLSAISSQVPLALAEIPLMNEDFENHKNYDFSIFKNELACKPAPKKEITIISITPKFDFIDNYYDSLARVKLNGKWGYVDINKRTIIPIQLAYAENFHNGMAKVCSNGTYMFVDKYGRKIPTPKYDKVFPFSDGLAKVQLGDRFGFIDKENNEIAITRYTYADDFHEGFAVVRQGVSDNYGYINTSGTLAIDFNYNSAERFYQGKAKVKLNGKWGFIDTAGKAIIPIKFADVKLFSEGLAGFRNDNNKWGFIDSLGHEKIPPQFNDVKYFSDGLAGFKIGDKWGFMDTNGKEIVSPKYDEIGLCGGGMYPVVLNSKWGFIDKTGKEVIPLKYDRVSWVSTFEQGSVVVELKGKLLKIDRTGKVLK